MCILKKEQMIAPTNWEMVPIDYKGTDAIIAYIGGIAPVKLVNTGLTQEEFDRLYTCLE